MCSGMLASRPALSWQVIKQIFSQDSDQPKMEDLNILTLGVAPKRQRLIKKHHFCTPGRESITNKGQKTSAKATYS